MEKMWNEELGVENALSQLSPEAREKCEKQLRDAKTMASLPGGFKISTDHVLKAPSEWRDVEDKKQTANERQVAGSHYKQMSVQPWDVIDSLPHAQSIGFYRGNALKYIMRAGEKGSAKEDYEKAIHYLEKLLEILD